MVIHIAPHDIEHQTTIELRLFGCGDTQLAAHFKQVFIAIRIRIHCRESLYMHLFPIHSVIAFGQEMILSLHLNEP